MKHKYTPELYLKRRVLQDQAEYLDVTEEEFEAIQKVLQSEDFTEDDYDTISENYCVQDTLSELRCSGEETGLRSKEYSRHYENDEVAVCVDGVWIGFTYWYGGGKHGEPDAIGWMEDAYFLDVTEEEVMTTVRTFTKQGG